MAGLDLDVIDLSIFAFIKDFANSGSCTPLQCDGGPYFWISHKKIIEEMPILGIKTPGGIVKRINKLIEADVLARHPNCEYMTKTFYKFGPNYDKLCFTPLSESSHPYPIVEGPLSDCRGVPLSSCIGNQIYQDNQINHNQKSATHSRARRTSEESCLFADSRFADYEKFAAEFSGPDYEDIDISYYYNSVADWSSRSGKKQKDWIATARSFMRRDNARGELKKKASMFKGLSQDAIDYLKSMQ